MQLEENVNYALHPLRWEGYFGVMEKTTLREIGGLGQNWTGDLCHVKATSWPLDHEPVGSTTVRLYLSESVKQLDSSDDFRNLTSTTILTTGSCNAFPSILHRVLLRAADRPVSLALETESLVFGHRYQVVDCPCGYEHSASWLSWKYANLGNN